MFPSPEGKWRGRRAAAVAVALVLVAAVGALVAQRLRWEERPLDVRTLGRYGRSHPGFDVAGSPDQWQQLRQSLVQQPALPDVDFRREWVVAAFMGEKPTGGYRVDVRDVVREGRLIRVTVVQEEPGPDDFVTMVITYPGHIVAAARPPAGRYTVVFADAGGRELLRREVTL